MATRLRARAPLALTVALGLGVGLGVSLPGPAASAAAVGCDADDGVCIDSGDATFKADRKTKSKDKRKRSAKNGGTLSVTIDGGRGSVFLNGRYVGTAPISGVELPAGKNDLHVRDGSTVLANGQLSVKRNQDVSLTVRHD